MAEPRTELEIGERIAAGEMASPVPFGNMWLVNLRITGTGLAYRVGLNEIVWRDPKHYLNDTFVKRCNGLPVIVNHPDENVLDTASFKDRIAGTVMLAYIRDDEVWAVVRIYDRELVASIMRRDVSTSPGVVFDDDSGNIEVTGDDDNLLIEGKPYLIDHIALVMPDKGSLGVWDKNNVPEGIEVSTNEDLLTMDEENQNLLAQLIQRAIGDAMKPVNQNINRLNARMDAMGAPACDARDDARDDSRDDARRDAMHDSRDDSRDDARRDAMHDSRDDARDDSRDDARRDSMRDDSRADDSERELELRAEISRLEKMLRREDRDSEHEREGMEARDDFSNNGSPHMEKEPHVIEQLRRANANEHGRDEGDARRDARRDASNTPPGLQHERERVGMERYLRDDANFDGHEIDARDDEKMSEARSRADAAFTAIGQQAPTPFRGETSLSYRRRALAVMQKHSKAHKSVNVRAIGDSAALSLVEDAIYNDAKQNVEHAMNNTRGKLYSVVRNDEAGRRIVEYKGDMNAWLSAFKQPGRVMAKINTQTQRAK